jgi:primosomal protein N' (replication factor Y)
MRVCGSCQQSELMTLGLGTEQLEKTIQTLFPKKTVCRIDRDNVKTFSQLKKSLEAIHRQEADILIGTQMLVKGHHFENVTLVAAIDVDNALFSSDFRAVERLGQSLVQVAGRAGRAEKRGEVFVQTHHPEHPLLQTLFQSGYVSFANALLMERMQTQLPPFAHLILLRAQAKDKMKVQRFLELAKTHLNPINSTASIQIAGPFPVAMEKKAGVYRMQLFLQSPNRSVLQKSLVTFLTFQEKQKPISGLKWVIDVDPIEMG